MIFKMRLTCNRFQSTLPVGEATRGGRDLESGVVDFNPRFPWGKRRLAAMKAALSIRFQSTLPVGEATPRQSINSPIEFISIHASRGGSDNISKAQLTFSRYFNPRFPWGKRRGCRGRAPSGLHFNPRFPWGKRPEQVSVTVKLVGFQSTLPVGEATRRPAGSP